MKLKLISTMKDTTRILTFKETRKITSKGIYEFKKRFRYEVLKEIRKLTLTEQTQQLNHALH